MLRSAPAALSRRRFLTVSTGTVGLVLAAGCAAPSPDDAPDPVLELIRAAERDARQFAAADGGHGGYSEAIRRIGQARRIHAERLNGLLGSGASGTSTPATEPAVCPPVEEVRARLRADADRAGAVALESDGVRAELTGSVSAACAAAEQVLLS